MPQAGEAWLPCSMVHLPACLLMSQSLAGNEQLPSMSCRLLCRLKGPSDFHAKHTAIEVFVHSTHCSVDCAHVVPVCADIQEFCRSFSAMIVSIAERHPSILCIISAPIATHTTPDSPKPCKALYDSAASMLPCRCCQQVCKRQVVAALQTFVSRLGRLRPVLTGECGLYMLK